MLHLTPLPPESCGMPACCAVMLVLAAFQAEKQHVTNRMFAARFFSHFVLHLNY